jgi:hypothetical protein
LPVASKSGWADVRFRQQRNVCHGRQICDDTGWSGVKLEYFECLARHQVTHVYNSWEAMPSVGEQMALAGSQTNPSLVAARFLLKPGRRYEEAVKTFQPYD